MAGLDFLPGIGAAIASIYTDYQAERKQKRIEELIEGLKKEQVRLEGRLNDAFNSMEILDIIEQITIHVSNERTEVKRRCYRNIFIHTITAESYDFDESEEMIRLVEQLTRNHIFILGILADPDGFNQTLEYPVFKEGRLSSSIGEIFKRILPDWELDNLIAIFKDLEGLHLTKDMSPSVSAMLTDKGIEHIKNKLTTRGLAFVEFITLN